MTPKTRFSDNLPISLLDIIVSRKETFQVLNSNKINYL